MRSYGYSDRLAAGTIATGGTLGIMIPPSVPLVIYDLIAEQGIGLLFIAGIVPGLLLATLFLIVVGITVRRDPLAAPPSPPLDPARRKEATRGTLPVLILFIVVLGGIYTGAFTATEAAGIGAFGAAVIAIVRGHMRSFSK